MQVLSKTFTRPITEQIINFAASKVKFHLGLDATNYDNFIIASAFAEFTIATVSLSLLLNCKCQLIVYIIPFEVEGRYLSKNHSTFFIFNTSVANAPYLT